MLARLIAAGEMARKGHWTLLVAKTLRAIGLRPALARMTCRVKPPGETFARDLRIHVELGDVISDDICRYGDWEPVLSREIVERARGGGLLVDVGANLGYFSLLWAAAHPGNRVWAFEASPRVFPKLVRNLRLNGLDGPIQTFQVALSDRDGISAFDLGPLEQTGWGGLADAPGPGSVNVATVRLDTVLSTIPRIDVLKTDVEGADTRVLRGAERALRARRVGAIYFEQSRARMAALGIEPGAPQRFLEDCGYAVSRVLDPRYEGDEEVTQWRALPC